MLPVAIVIAAVVVLGAGTAVAIGLTRMKSKKKENETPEKYFNYGKDGDAHSVSEDQSTEEPPELINLVDYYADLEEEPDDEEEVEAPPPVSEVRESPEVAIYDKLCNVKIGRGFLLDCQNQLNIGANNSTPYAVAYFDFNRFRFVNTLKGFSIGDYAITRIAQEAQSTFPSGSLITRIYADHFVILFPFMDEDSMEEIFGLLKRATDRIRADIGAKQGMQICMGVAKTTGGDASYDIFKLIIKANIARHCNKINKSESFSFFDESMITSYLYGESSVEDYKELQYTDDFALYLKPQLSLKNKRVASCIGEAHWPYEETSDNGLLRDRGGCLSSGNFKVAYQTCRAVSRLRKSDGVVLPAMFALSEIDLLCDDVDAFFARCLSEFQLEATTVIVVVSQHFIRLNPEIALRQLQKLKNIGLKIAVSGFERTVKSLDALSGFSPDFLKLNRSFAHEVSKWPERQSDVLRALSLASGVGASIIFEGVDSAKDMGYLATNGSGMIEGRYVGPSQTADEFAKEVKDLVKTPYDPNSTVLLDDTALGKGNLTVY
ncbi:MAG: EAL domain-containing protein [Oscillospiraceae bacterium]|nr:EAL domain-containing protein [Oscillospiraceae bacterium]